MFALLRWLTFKYTNTRTVLCLFNWPILLELLTVRSDTPKVNSWKLFRRDCSRAGYPSCRPANSIKALMCYTVPANALLLDRIEMQMTHVLRLCPVRLHWYRHLRTSKDRLAKIAVFLQADGKFCFCKFPVTLSCIITGSICWTSLHCLNRKGPVYLHS